MYFIHFVLLFFLKNELIISINSSFFLFFYIWVLVPACSESLQASQNPLAVGSNVTLSSNSSVSAGAWVFNNDIVVMIFGGGYIISDQWKDRVTFSSTSNQTSLAISSLQVADSGTYTLQALNLFRVQLQLSVQGKADFYHSALCLLWCFGPSVL